MLVIVVLKFVFVNMMVVFLLFSLNEIFFMLFVMVFMIVLLVCDLFVNVIVLIFG